MIDGARASRRALRRGFFAGWFFGFGYFLVSLYWVGFAFLVQAEQFAWMAPFAVCGLPAFLAIFTALACALCARFGGGGTKRAFAFATLYMIAEYARGHILTGLPWNLPGQALAGTAAGAQTAAWWGVYGLSFLVVLLAVAPAAMKNEDDAGIAKGALFTLAASAMIFAIGGVRLALAPRADHDGVYIRIVQPNIPQREKIDADLWRRNYDLQIELSAAPAAAGGAGFILWPENAVPVIDEAPEGLKAVSQRLPKNATLIAGAVRRETDEDGETRYFNSVSVIAETPTGRAAIAHYDKHHLVPFGEYLPLFGLLKALGLSELTPYGDDGFTGGDGPKTIRVGGAAFSPLICYESIFPGRVYPPGDRPEWIATVTNDSWFGDTAGPRQHFDQARLRSIETGLPMARAANSGVSGLIDGAGRVIDRIGLNSTGVIDAALPEALPTPLYARVGDLLFFLMLIAGAFAGFFAGRRGG